MERDGAICWDGGIILYDLEEFAANMLHRHEGKVVVFNRDEGGHVKKGQRARVKSVTEHHSFVSGYAVVRVGLALEEFSDGVRTLVLELPEQEFIGDDAPFRLDVLFSPGSAIIMDDPLATKPSLAQDIAAVLDSHYHKGWFHKLSNKDAAEFMVFCAAIAKNNGR